MVEKTGKEDGGGHGVAKMDFEQRREIFRLRSVFGREFWQHGVPSSRRGDWLVGYEAKATVHARAERSARGSGLVDPVV